MSLTSEALIDYLRNDLGLDEDEIDSETLLFSSGLLDSFSMVEMLVFIERESGVRLSPTDVSLDNLDSVARVFAFLKRTADEA